MTIQEAVNNFKDLIEQSVIEGGDEGKTAMIRSSRPILNIHEAVKTQLVLNDVNQNLIYPPLNERKPELKLAGSLKQKDQDVCVVPNNCLKVAQKLTDGLLAGTEDLYGDLFTERTLAINVRSQISSIQKNFDTLYERTFSEAQNLHDRSPKMVLGEVYMIAVPEYDDKAFRNFSCVFKNINPRMVEKYIKSFKHITDRKETLKNFYQYEATCLLIVDFNRKIPKIYHTTKELIDDGLLPENSEIKYEGLEWDTFSAKLLSIYDERFGSGKFN